MPWMAEHYRKPKYTDYRTIIGDAIFKRNATEASETNSEFHSSSLGTIRLDKHATTTHIGRPS